MNCHNSKLKTKIIILFVLILLSYFFKMYGQNKNYSLALNGEWINPPGRPLKITVDIGYIIGPGKGSWRGHNLYYRKIRYLGNRNWSCEEEYHSRGRGFYWKPCTIYMSENFEEMKVKSSNGNFKTWKRKGHFSDENFQKKKPAAEKSVNESSFKFRFENTHEATVYPRDYLRA